MERALCEDAKRVRDRVPCARSFRRPDVMTEGRPSLLLTCPFISLLPLASQIANSIDTSMTVSCNASISLFFHQPTRLIRVPNDNIKKSSFVRLVAFFFHISRSSPLLSRANEKRGWCRHRSARSAVNTDRRPHALQPAFSRRRLSSDYRKRETGETLDEKSAIESLVVIRGRWRTSRKRDTSASAKSSNIARFRKSCTAVRRFSLRCSNS